MTLTTQLPLIVPFDSETRLDTFVWEPAQRPLALHCGSVDPAQPGLTWLWGKAGAGKSHLLQGVAQQFPEAIYLRARHLLGYEPTCLQTFHHSRLLLLDDVDLLVTPAWEEALFCLCQALLQSGAQAWFSASLPPAAAPFALADLKSRLQLALVFEVLELSNDAKVRALVARAQLRGIELRDEVVQFMLARNPRSMHELMALLDRLDQLALAEQRRVTIPFVKSVMGW